MRNFKVFTFLLFSVVLIFMLATCSDDDEAGEWEPVDDDDDDTADDDDGDDDDDDGCDCDVTVEEWQDLLDRCDSAVGAVYDMFDDPTGESLCNECDACLVECFNNNTFCSTNFVNCFWDCA